MGDGKGGRNRRYGGIRRSVEQGGFLRAMAVLPFFLQSYDLLFYFLCHMGKLGAETGSGELHAGAVSRHRLDSLNTSNDLPKGEKHEC